MRVNVDVDVIVHIYCGLVDVNISMCMLIWMCM